VKPARALDEARRILVPGGRLLVIDLLAHNEEWVRDQLQHVHLGFTEAALANLLEKAGFERMVIHRAARDPQPPHFMTLVATGVAPAHGLR
jgi:ArsR family transcriptional regulator